MRCTNLSLYFNLLASFHLQEILPCKPISNLLGCHWFSNLLKCIIASLSSLHRSSSIAVSVNVFIASLCELKLILLGVIQFDILKLKKYLCIIFIKWIVPNFFFAVFMQLHLCRYCLCTS